LRRAAARPASRLRFRFAVEAKTSVRALKQIRARMIDCFDDRSSGIDISMLILSRSCYFKEEIARDNSTSDFVKVVTWHRDFSSPPRSGGEGGSDCTSRSRIPGIWRS
jgi:hypothetical protein